MLLFSHVSIYIVKHSHKMGCKWNKDKGKCYYLCLENIYNTSEQNVRNRHFKQTFCMQRH